MEKTTTLGSLAYDALLKEPESRDPIELQRELQKKYIDELVDCVENYKKIQPRSFFVCVITKREKLLQPILRNYFIARDSCPTPDYDQAVYKYNHESEQIEYLWCIPDREACLTYRENALQVVPEERQLLQHILDFADGTLYRLSKKLNKEQVDSPLLDI